MTAVARTRFLCAAVLLSVAGTAAAADPLADLLPPQARQLEKRAFGAGDREMEMMRYRGDRGRPAAVFSPDGKLLAVCQSYNGLGLFDVATGRNLGTLGAAERSEGMSLAFAPDGTHLLTVNWAGHRGESCPVTLWNVKKREKVRSLDEDVNDTMFFAAAFAPDGKTLALGGGMTRRGGNNSGLHFWDVATGDEVRKVEGLLAPDGNRRFGGLAQAMTYAPDGRTLALLTDTKLILLEQATNKVRTQVALQPPPDPRLEMNPYMNMISVGAVVFSPDGRTLAVGGNDGTLRRFEVHTGRELPPLTGHTTGIIALCFTPDGKSLLSFGADSRLFVWSADANRDWRPKALPPGEPALDRLWDTLRTDDPLDLYGCAQLFGASPDATVAFLRKRLTPVPVGDSERIQKLVADLQKAEYNDRKKAVVELRKLGALAVPALRQAAERGGEDVVRRLLFELESLSPLRDNIRAVRAMGVLERIGTDDARALLGELAKGAPEAALTVEAKAALERSAKGAGGLGAAPKLEALWENLGGEDSATAFQSARLLAARPETAVPFLRDRLRDLTASDAFDNDPKRVAKLLLDLDSEDFDTRDRAGKGLKTLGKLVEPALRKALEGGPTAEAKRQIEEVLAEVGRQAQSAEVLRVDRALEALEWAGTAESRQVIGALAKEARGQWLRDAAAAALRRQGP